MLSFKKFIYIIIVFFFFNNTYANYEMKFFDFTLEDINEKKISTSVFKGKTILLVNVASNCGFTKQYTEL